jgi:CMP-N,N'-diacetyllegionaminic acid synthase
VMSGNNFDRYISIVIIPARGGSKGVHRKALQPIGDMPLIAFTIRDALSINGVSKVVVSTDDPEIKEVSVEYGAEVPFLRPSELAKDNSNLEDAHKHALSWFRENQGFTPDIEIIMSPTHPFRRHNLVNHALKLGVENPGIFNVGSISKAGVNIDNFWARKNGKIERFHCHFNGRPKESPVYQSAFSFNIIFTCRPHLCDRRIPIILNEIESIDIDVPKDLEIARMVIEEGLYPFDE